VRKQSLQEEEEEDKQEDDWRKKEFTELIEGLKQKGMLKVHRGIGRLRKLKK
jgi:hypothetical protein